MCFAKQGLLCVYLFVSARKKKNRIKKKKKGQKLCTFILLMFTVLQGECAPANTCSQEMK